MTGSMTPVQVVDMTFGTDPHECQEGIEDLTCWSNKTCLQVPNDLSAFSKNAVQSYDRPEFDDAFAIAALFFASLSIVISIGAALFIFVNRSKPVVRMSQYEFMLLLALGYAFFNLAVLLQSVAYIGFIPGICRAYFAVFYISSTCILVVLALKTYRAYRLLKSVSSLTVLKITNKILFRWLIGSEIVVSVLLAWWFLSYPIVINPCKNSGLMCQAATQSSNINGNVFNIILTVILVFLSFVALLAAFKARRVPSIAGESKGILISILFFWFGIFVVVTVIYGELDLSVTVKSFIVSFYFFTSTVVSLYVLVFHKYRYFDLDADQVRKIFLQAASTSLKLDTNEVKPQSTTTFASMKTSSGGFGSNAQSTSATSNASRFYNVAIV